MNTPRAVSIVTAVVSMWLMFPASGESQDVVQAPRLPSLSAIQAQDWKERREAFDALIEVPETPANADRRRQLLFELLTVENETVTTANARLQQRAASGLPPEEGFTEGYTEYYASAIAAVARLGDPRSQRHLPAR